MVMMKTRHDADLAVVTEGLRSDPVAGRGTNVFERRRAAARIAAITTSDEACGIEGFAGHLAFRTTISVEQALVALQICHAQSTI